MQGQQAKRAKPEGSPLGNSTWGADVIGVAVEVRFTVGLPARGRQISGDRCSSILTGILPDLVQRSLLYRSLDPDHFRAHILSVEDQQFLRTSLRARGLVAFVANDSVLPRKSGADDLPMSFQDAIKFTSPKDLEVTFDLPNRKTVKGMGLKHGISLIVGGGFHGKSTLLQALEVGCYNHVPGDGREFVVADPTCVKIRAEDGRSVRDMDISAFIGNLPFGRSTTAFSTADASGSTSQAANIIEAIEAGSRCFLIDEDTCATNFMIRDDRMAQLVAKDKEPITPFIKKVRSLYETQGVSSIVVIGGSGDYFEVADCVVMMDCYTPKDVTKEAQQISVEHGGIPVSQRSPAPPFGAVAVRKPVQAAFRGEGKTVARGLKKIQWGEMDLDLLGIEQLVEISQTRAITDSMQFLATKHMNGERSLAELLDLVDKEVA